MFNFHRLRESLHKLRGSQLDEQVGQAMSAPQPVPPDVVTKARKELQADVQKCVAGPRLLSPSQMFGSIPDLLRHQLPCPVITANCVKFLH